MPAPASTRHVSSANVGGLVAGVEADGHAGSRSGRGAARAATPASPAAARRTSARFMRFGPAPSAPRSPAVPNWSRAPNRSARPVGVAGGEHGLELGPGVGVGVLGQPGPGRRLDAPATPLTASGRPRPAAGPCARPRPPAAITSAWSSFSPVSPAARFETSENPSTSAPRCTAARHSCTVDMPTRSAPRVRAMRTSAGVSYCGPANPAYTPSSRSGSTVRARSRSRGDHASVMSTKRGPRSSRFGPVRGERSGEVEVVGDEHALADPVALLHPAGRVGEHDGGAAGQHRGAHAVHDGRSARAPRTGAPGRGRRAAAGPPHRIERTVLPWPGTVDGAKPPSSVTGTSATTSPSWSAAGVQPLPSTSATSWRLGAGHLGQPCRRGGGRLERVADHLARPARSRSCPSDMPGRAPVWPITAEAAIEPSRPARSWAMPCV